MLGTSIRVSLPPRPVARFTRGRFFAPSPGGRISLCCHQGARLLAIMCKNRVLDREFGLINVRTLTAMDNPEGSLVVSFHWKKFISLASLPSGADDKGVAAKLTPLYFGKQRSPGRQGQRLGLAITAWRLSAKLKHASLPPSQRWDARGRSGWTHLAPSSAQVCHRLLGLASSGPHCCRLPSGALHAQAPVGSCSAEMVWCGSEAMAVFFI